MQDEMMKQLAKDLGIDSLTPVEQETIITQLGEIALKSASIAVMEALPESSREEFVNLTEGGDPEKLRAFLDKHVPNHEQIAQAAVAEEVKRLKEFQAAAAK